MTDTRKGFTLVELLAVIVILAIIMIIAIPSVLGTMTTARQKSFCEYVSKVYQAGQNKYLTEVGNGEITGAEVTVTFTNEDASTGTGTVYVYDVKTDLGLSSTGEYDGYVAILKATKATGNKTRVYVFLIDNEYVTTGADGNAGYVDYTADDFGEPKPDDLIDKGTATKAAFASDATGFGAAITGARLVHET